MNALRVLLSLGIVGALILAPLSLVFQPAQAAPAAVNYYVSPTGDALHDCTVDDPCNIDHAIMHAVSGDTIYLYEGTYIDYTSLVMADLGEDINMFGGLYGHLHTPMGLRLSIDPVHHPSILNGETERSGIYIHGGVTPIIDGITFINGKGNLAYQDLCGAPQLSAQGCGGAIFIYQAAPTIQHCVFYDNRGVRVDMPAGKMGYGGAIFVESPTGQVLIQHNTFENNRATDVNNGDGSAIAIHGNTGNVTIFNNLFKDNVATYRGGAIAAEYYAGTLLWIDSNRFESNTAFLAGAGIYLDYVGHATITHNWFEGNHGQLGSPDNGTVDARFTGLIFNQNTLIDNDPNYGLQIFKASLFSPKVINNLFVRSGELATIRIQGWGGNSGTETFTAILKHNTLVEDGLSDTLAVEASAVGCKTFYYCAVVTVDNTILFKYGTGFSAPYYQGGKITSDYTLFYQVTTRTDGYALRYNDVEEDYAGFKDYLHDDYHLVRNALARDKGKDAGVTSDFEGDPRPLGGGYDLGYDEFAYHILVPVIRK